MMINIEELRADIEAGTSGDWDGEYDNCDHGTGKWWKVGPYNVEAGYNLSAEKDEEWLADKRRAERLPQLEREYLAMRGIVSLWDEIMQDGIFKHPHRLLKAQELTAQAMKGETQ